jgi:hypothetical protein
VARPPRADRRRLLRRRGSAGQRPAARGPQHPPLRPPLLRQGERALAKIVGRAVAAPGPGPALLLPPRRAAGAARPARSAA